MTAVRGSTTKLHFVTHHTNPFSFSVDTFVYVFPPQMTKWQNENQKAYLSSVPLGDRSMSSSLSASQLHTVNMRDPLNRVLGEN